MKKIDNKVKWYLKQMFYIDRGKEQISRYSSLITTFGVIITVYNQYFEPIKPKIIPIMFAGILILIWLMGYILVKKNVVSYNRQLMNYQNPMLVEIHKKIMEEKK